VTVVLGYVDRPEAVAALDQALAVVRRTGERLVVVSARRPAPAGGRPPPASVTGLAAVEERLTRESVPHAVQRPDRGRQPADELREAVLANRARLLVIGMRGGAVLGRLLRGTTAQALVLDAPCDVLVVKAQPS
jgi:nucleotide-binding universal stress UspA family protein